MFCLGFGRFWVDFFFPEAAVGWAEKPKMLNINLNQMGSSGTHKTKTYLSKEKNSRVHIRIGKCI